jgi:signal transduction histidine kinase/ActR/RegA family two-component response regulator
VVRSGVTSVLNDISEEKLQEWTRDPEALAGLRALGMTAALIAPISVGFRVLGAVALVSTLKGRRYEPSDVMLAEELGRRAGVALDNAQLYRKAQRALREAEQAAVRADEASRAKDAFLATVSHELRTPLNAILGWSVILKDRVSDAQLEKPVDVIYRNAQAQVKIIDDILDVSRIITGKLQLDLKPVDLGALARHAIEVVRPSAEAKKITVELEPEAAPCLLVGDPERLQQVIWNLLSNAVKFTPQGGRIDVHVGSENSQLILSVKDSGQGITADFLPFVFDRFKQADSSMTRRIGGLGLGLALVRHIVELHGGRAGVASEGAGAGSTFTITLPVRAIAPVQRPSSAPPSQSQASAAAPHIDLRGARVLVVDDDADARELIATVLSEAGGRVETAGSAARGFEAFERFRPELLISDIGMPEEDGFSLIRRIRSLSDEDGGRVPALALSAFTRAEDREHALDAGFTRHLAKPVEPTELACAAAQLAEALPS